MTPEYVDTTTSTAKWYGYNISLLIANCLMFYLAALVVEYEVARLTHPNVGYIPTPLWADLTLSTIVIILALANLAVLIFVFLRHLWRRPWMLATTIIGWMLLAIIALLLNENFLPVMFPSLPL